MPVPVCHRPARRARLLAPVLLLALLPVMPGCGSGEPPDPDALVSRPDTRSGRRPARDRAEGSGANVRGDTDTHVSGDPGADGPAADPLSGITQDDRDYYRSQAVDRRDPRADRDGRHLDVLPPRESWNGGAMPMADAVDYANWPYSRQAQGSADVVALSGIVINRTNRDCRHLSIKAYCLDEAGQVVAQGGTTLRDIDASERLETPFEILIGSVPRGARIQRVVVARGTPLWATDY